MNILPKKRGKKRPDNQGCNIAICQVLSENFNVTKNFGWRLVVEIEGSSGFNDLFTIASVDLTKCQVSIEKNGINEILSCKELESFVSYEIQRDTGVTGGVISIPCNILCNLLKFNLDQQNNNGWGKADAFTIFFNGLPPVVLTEVDLARCEVTVNEDPITRSCADIANTWTSFQIHQ
ncbi:MULTISPECIES: hypothetical protein [Priestia]|uniref:hypothetical protein n=1 Tax=Priestia TaxID=2800373 RepID=UPI0035565A53